MATTTADVVAASSAQDEQISALQAVANEVRSLREANVKIATQPPDRREFLWSMVLQVLAAIIGILFGVFALLAWIAAKRGNGVARRALDMATQSTRLSLLAYCQSVQGVRPTSPE